MLTTSISCIISEILAQNREFFTWHVYLTLVVRVTRPNIVTIFDMRQPERSGNKVVKKSIMHSHFSPVRKRNGRTELLMQILCFAINTVKIPTIW